MSEIVKNAHYILCAQLTYSIALFCLNNTTESSSINYIKTERYLIN